MGVFDRLGPLSQDEAVSNVCVWEVAPTEKVATRSLFFCGSNTLLRTSLFSTDNELLVALLGEFKQRPLRAVPFDFLPIPRQPGKTRQLDLVALGNSAACCSRGKRDNARDRCCCSFMSKDKLDTIVAVVKAEVLSGIQSFPEPQQRSATVSTHEASKT